LFTALTFQLSFVHTKLSSDYIAVLEGNGFLRDRDVKRMAQIFREGAMAEMKENWQKYLPFLKDCLEAQFYICLIEYSMSGQFAGDFGDLLQMACANFLGAVIVLLSSDPHFCGSCCRTVELGATSAGGRNSRRGQASGQTAGKSGTSVRRVVWRGLEAAGSARREEDVEKIRDK
jgi:hypothetical protein